MYQQKTNAEILVLDDGGNNLGMMAYREAQSLAVNRDLDLVQINKTGNVPVYKIMDHGKYKYDKNKHKHKQKQATIRVKEMIFKVRIDSHDLAIKVNKIKDFLSRGMEVKIVVSMKGREKLNPQLAHQKMDDILKELEGLAIAQERREVPSFVFVTVRPNRGTQTHVQGEK